MRFTYIHIVEQQNTQEFVLCNRCILHPSTCRLGGPADRKRFDESASASMLVNYDATTMLVNCDAAAMLLRCW